MLNNNKRFIWTIYYEWNPKPISIIEIELRYERNPQHPNYGKVTIYNYSYYEPLKTFKNIYYKIEDAIIIVEKLGAIAVKEK